MAINFPLKFPNLFGSSPKPEKDKSQAAKQEGGSDHTGQGLLSGFPFVNYGAVRYQQAKALTIPRLKYTWLAEFQVNQAYLKSGRLSTNIDHFLDNDNRIYLNLKSIDHPKPNITTETLRSSNKYVKLPTKVEYPPAQMTFDDDATSIVMALWKEYFAFYSHTGDIGFDLLLSTDNVVSNQEGENIMVDENMGTHGYGHLVSVEGTEPRRRMDIRGSIGMRLKANNFRHFFDRIVIYDLGTEPDSVNIYYYHRPVFTSFDHGGLDWEDRTGKVETSVTFEYENYYFALGKARWTVRDVIKRMTGEDVPITTGESVVSTTHGDMRVPGFPKIPQGIVDPPQPIYEENNESTSLVQNPPEEQVVEEPRDIQGEIDDLNDAWTKFRADNQCIFNNPALSQQTFVTNNQVCQKGYDDYQRDLAALNQELAVSSVRKQEEDNRLRSKLSTQEAVKNTEEANGVSVDKPGTKQAVRTTAQTQAIQTELQTVQFSKTKLENTEQSLENVISGVENALELDDDGKLENSSSGKMSAQQRQQLEGLLTTKQRELRNVQVEIGLVGGRENQLLKQLGM